MQRFIAQAGIAARRKAEDLIVQGRVKVNGKVVTELGTQVDPTTDMVSVDGQGLHKEDAVYILFNKPKGCITSLADDEGRLTVMDYLPNLPARVAPVGRLDFYTEGVLLLTNDGELASRLLAPKHHVEKTYHVKVRGTLSELNIKQLRRGVTLDDGSKTMPAEVSMLPGESKHSWVAITLHEGKSRQIHRMMEAVGFTVTKLQRVAFGNLTHFGLRVGDARELNQHELNELRTLAGLGPSKGVARGKWTAKREDTELARRAHARGQLEAAAAAGASDPDKAPAAAPTKRPPPSRPMASRGVPSRPVRGRAEPARAAAPRGARVERPARGARADSSVKPKARTFTSPAGGRGAPRAKKPAARAPSKRR